MNKIVLGSFFGDEGKGQTVHNLCKLHSADKTIVVRFSGGHQVGHTVRHGKLEHTFSNYGSGTLLGVPTYWSEYCTVDPMTTMKELEVLNKLNIAPQIIYSPLCQVVTPLDVVTQWNDEENLKHGTVGTGFKSTLTRVAAGYHLTVSDCLNIMVLRTKMFAMFTNYFKMPSSQHPCINIDEWCVKTHTYFKSVQIAPTSILDCYKHRIFEGSQGILLDQRFGIMPYCTPSNTTCQNAAEMLSKIYKLGTTEIFYVTRPYITRHGNGPIPTTEKVREVTDKNNQYNEFQKSLRATELDISLLQHSVNINRIFQPIICGQRWDTLVVTHKDELNDKVMDKLNCLHSEFSSIGFSEFDKLYFEV